MDDTEVYERARKRVHQIRGFYVHALVYALVNVLLAVINFVVSRGVLWFYWPLLGWGIGLFAHGVSVFGFGGLWGKEWEDRKIKDIVEKNRSR